jgi:chorismate synthase
MNNSFGHLFRITTFGESHGPAIGVVIDGCPAGLFIDNNFINAEMAKRKPGQSSLTTARKEDDGIEILSGVFEDHTTGAPIAMLIRNKDQQSADYDQLKNIYRPSHADFTWEKKFGLRDHRGGGRTSARETAARVAAGAVAQLLLRSAGITIHSFVSQVGNIRLEKNHTELDLSSTEKNSIRCPDEATAAKMIRLIENIKSKGDTIGGTVTCIIKNTMIGLGNPVFGKLHATLAFAMMGINAAHGFDYGSGFEAIDKPGSELNDVFVTGGKNEISTSTNNSGGIQGGISNGQDIYFRVLFKPVATLMQDQQTVDREGNTATVHGKGRHDPCVLPRAVPIVTAMAALVLSDHLLMNQSSKTSYLGKS